MSTFTLDLPTSPQQDTPSWAAVAFIASYSSEATRRTYTTQLRLWMGWCAEHHLDPLVDIPRQTSRYDRARGALDRNPTYIVDTYVAGATGAPLTPLLRVRRGTAAGSTCPETTRHPWLRAGPLIASARP